jgi:hypothetical protein
MKNLEGYDIPGWFKPSECEKLYQSVLESTGDILEIGHFLGRSTSFICQGIRDSGKQRIFKSYDLGFTSYCEVQKFYNEIYGYDIEIPKMYDIAFSQNKSTTEIANENLKHLNLNFFVTLISGNFIELDFHKYDFIFCDAVHDLSELKNNLPHIISHSNKSCTWVFHDMNFETINYINSFVDCEFIELFKSLGIFKFND